MLADTVIFPDFHAISRARAPPTPGAKHPHIIFQKTRFYSRKSLLGSRCNVIMDLELSLKTPSSGASGLLDRHLLLNCFLVYLGT